MGITICNHCADKGLLWRNRDGRPVLSAAVAFRSHAQAECDIFPRLRDTGQPTTRRSMKTCRILAVFTACVCVCSTPGRAIDLLTPDEDKIRREVWDPSVEKGTTNYSGTVFLDGNPLPDVMVTDGIHFVRTGEDGRYRIGMRFDAMTPLLDTRVISVRWPEGTWAERAPGERANALLAARGRREGYAGQGGLLSQDAGDRAAVRRLLWR